MAATSALTLSSSSSSSMGLVSSSSVPMLPGEASRPEASGICPRQLPGPHAIGDSTMPPSSSLTSASASSIHGDNCPSANGDATPELTIEASADADIREFAIAKFGVSTPKPGVPADFACAAEEPSLLLSFSRSPCSLMLSRCSCIISSTHNLPFGPLCVLPLLHRLLPLLLSLTDGAALWELWGDPELHKLAWLLVSWAERACSEGFSRNGGLMSIRGVGCGDTTGVEGSFGWRVCCKALIFSSCLIRQELRPQRAHLSSSIRVASVT
mmetsp:Transcript_13571/g.28344  ORF Transcript_13571/g.28344 Transcript_13571/m.28344 type:complete len:269 (-) Transcript_13571:654-1460(-)